MRVFMFGCPIEYSDEPIKPKRKYRRKGTKAPSAPRKDKMVHSAPIVKGGTTP